MKWTSSSGLIGLGAAIVFGLCGCAGWDGSGSNRFERTSLVKYLYPEGSRPSEKPQIPTLRLPLRVGIAWVPAERDLKRGAMEAISEAELQNILGKVDREFRSLPFIEDIQVIPASYLEPGGGFENLDQLRTMFGIDVVALVSRDQKQATGQTEFSILYWTIVGAYIVPAERNETHTMVDTAVFDIESRKLLFRAPGTSRQKEFATPVTASDEFRDSRFIGLQQASTNMVANLKTELATFQQRIKEKPETAKVEYRPGYTGGGAGSWPDVALVAGIAGAAIAAARRRK